MEIEIDARLREMSYGDWDGRLWRDIEDNDHELLAKWGEDWLNVSPPRGESATQLAQRVRDVLVDLVDRIRSDTVAVTHAGWIRIATSLLLGEPLARTFDRSIDYNRAAVFTVERRELSLAAWNVRELA